MLSVSSTIQKPNVGLSEKIEQVTKYLNINRFDNEPIKFYLLHLPINVQIDDETKQINIGLFYTK